jgi:hypothetical protein
MFYIHLTLIVLLIKKMKKMKMFNPIKLLLVGLFYCVIISGSTAQNCTGPNKLKVSNQTAFSVRIMWSMGGSIETLNYKPANSTQWQTIRNVTSPFILPGLTAATVYDYYISTDCATYTGVIPRSRFTTLDMCMPAKNVAAANIKVNSAQISWTRGTGISSEVLVYKEVGSNNSRRIVTPYGDPTFRLSGLKINTEYEVILESDCPINSQPTNNQGTVMSPPYRFRTAATASCADADFYLFPSGYYQISAQWFPESDKAASYEVCYKPLGSFEPPVCKALPKDDVTFTLNGKPNTTYEVELKTTCSDGTLYSQKDTTTTRELPKCSINASYGTITTSGLTIGISGDLGNFKDVVVYYKKVSETQYTIVRYPSQSTIVLTGLLPSTDYNIYVASGCDGGAASTSGAVNNFRTLGIPCPLATNLTTTTPVRNVTPYCQFPDCLGIDWDYSFASTNPAFSVNYKLEELVGSIWMLRTNYTDANINFRFFPFGRLQAQSLVAGNTYRFTISVMCDAVTSTAASRTFSIAPLNSALVRNGQNNTAIEAEITKIKAELKVDEVLFAPANLFKKNNQEGILTVMPNPTTDMMTVILPNEAFEQLTIFNIEGRIVKQQLLDNQSFSQSINCSDLPNGMYLITAKGNGQAVNTRFVKQ